MKKTEKTPFSGTIGHCQGFQGKYAFSPIYTRVLWNFFPKVPNHVKTLTQEKNEVS